MKTIALIGMPGSGKDVAIHLLKELIDFDYIRMGDIVIEETKNRGLEISDKNVGATANALRREMGMDAIAKLCLEKVLASKKETSIINGTRGLEEIKYFKNHIEDLIVLGIHSSPKTRYKRLIKRKREDDIQTEDEFKKRDERELKWGIAEAFVLSDEIIQNQGTLDELKKDLSLFLKKYKI